MNKEKLCEFIGWHLGDGCISKNKRYSEYTLTGDLKEEIEFYQKIVLPAFNELFSKNIKLKEYKSNGVCGIYIFDKEFVDYLQKITGLKSGKKLNVKIPNVVKTKLQKKAFIRGLFDTDGSIYFCKSNYKNKVESLKNIYHYKPKIKIATISESLIKSTYDILKELDIKCRIQKPIKQRKPDLPMHSIIIDTIEGTKKYLREIGFRNYKHKTKIEIWEKFGFCPPKTNFQERLNILNGRKYPTEYYPRLESIDILKEELTW